MIRGNHWPVALETVRLQWRPQRSIEGQKGLHSVIRNIFGLTGIVVSAPMYVHSQLIALRYLRFQALIDTKIAF
jgi:hypothetical protein